MVLPRLRRGVMHQRRLLSSLPGFFLPTAGAPAVQAPEVPLPDLSLQPDGGGVPAHLALPAGGADLAGGAAQLC